MRLTVRTPADFRFLPSICSHGFFVLAPNRWDPRRRVLETVVPLADGGAVQVRLREAAGKPKAGQSPQGRLVAETGTTLTPAQRADVLAAVRRLLRLDEDLAAFYDLCRVSPTHRPAAAVGFGRLLSCASLFEAIVKVMCTCNVTWRQTVSMVERIVEQWGVPADADGRRAFPPAAKLAGIRPTTLRRQANVGYRAEFIHCLARDVAGGRLDLDGLEQFGGTSDELFRTLKRIHGVGDYAAGHLCMLLGRYDRLAVDTEMMSFLKKRYPRRTWTPARVREHYRGWHPYQFLAYWYELWSDYERQQGEAAQWSPAEQGRGITESGRRKRGRQRK